MVVETLKSLVTHLSLDGVDCVYGQFERLDGWMVGPAVSRMLSGQWVTDLRIRHPPEQASSYLTFIVEARAGFRAETIEQGVLDEITVEPRAEPKLWDFEEMWVAPKSFLARSVTRIRVTYQAKQGVGDLLDIDERLIREFGEEIATHHAWPFLRERLDSQAASMRMTPLLLGIRRRPESVDSQA